MHKRSLVTLLLYSGVFLVAGLFCYEIAHYSLSTAVSLQDQQYLIPWHSHPGCKVSPDEPYDFTCPLEGYNWVEVECLTALCTYRDPNATAMTEQRQVKHAKDLDQDLAASLQTVPTVSGQQARKLLEDAANPRAEVTAVDPDEAMKLMLNRDLKRLNEIARNGHP